MTNNKRLEEINAMWRDYIASVVNADIEAFESFHAAIFIGHVGGGVIESDRAKRMADIASVFEQASNPGDVHALQPRCHNVSLLSDDIAVCDYECFLRNEQVNYAMSAILHRENGSWLIVHSADSTSEP